MRSEQIVAALARRETYPQRPDRVIVRETHISWVFLAGDRAYKLKKPVALDFVDYGTPQRRRLMCEEEVRLNRRLASGIYLGVLALVPTEGGVELAAEDDPRAIDYVVEMRRFDERRTLAGIARRGELGGPEIEAVARTLADFHARAPRVRLDGLPSQAIERRLTENFQELRKLIEQRSELARVLALERFTAAFLLAHSPTFDARAWRGFTREGHGDLRAEHVLLEDGVQVVDCVEFDRRLREIDVAEDLSFLAMDLAAAGEQLPRALIDAYRRAGGDPGEDRLLAFYALGKALVRAKVELLAAAQHAPSSAAHGAHSAAARELLALAERLAWRARLPLVIVICGLPAAGKSELAKALAAVSGLSHLSSDVTRKRLAGIGPDARGGREIYSAPFSALTYSELGARAAAEEARHGGALVDATFRRRADREAFAQSFDGAAPLLFVECRVAREVRAQRAEARDERPENGSDAGRTVALEQAGSWEPLDEIDGEAHLALRSDRPVQRLLGDLLALLDRRLDLAGLPAAAGPAASCGEPPTGPRASPG